MASSPSIVEGLPQAEERLRRAKGVNFIYQVGILLELPQITLWVAGVFFHRFYMRYSMAEERGGIHHYVGHLCWSPKPPKPPKPAVAQWPMANPPTPAQNIAATALFLANKTEENCRKTKDLIIAVAKVAQKNTKLIIDEQSKEYWKWRDSILAYEELMLETLTFDLLVDSPYPRVYEYMNQLDLVQSKPLRDSAWAFCNDACLTVLPLLLNGRDVAIAAIFFATSVTREKIDDVNGEPWWRFLKASETSTVRAVQLMADFYRENPLRKQDAKVPGSPEFTLESTRRRGELSLSQMDLDSSQYGTPTPLGGEDRGVRSPSRAEREGSDAVKDVAIKKEEEDEVVGGDDGRGDSDAALKVAANDLSTHNSSSSGAVNGGGLVSPRIKRSTEPEEGVERESKRMRLSDEEEGEAEGDD